MVFSYSDIDIRSLCEKEEVAINQLGLNIASLFLGRLADLEACDFLSDLIVGNLRVDPTNSEQFKIDIDENYRLIVCSGHIKADLTDDGDIDSSKISRIKIIKIENGND